MTAIELFQRCRDIVGNSYPPKTCAFPCNLPVAGRGFFATASGSFHDSRIDHPIGRRDVMFVGQDWGDISSTKSLYADVDADMKSKTALELVSLLTTAAMPFRECFFTNALFGLRQTGSDMNGSPGWRSSKFVERCADALWLQIQVVTPRAIICLGRNAPDLLVQLFPLCRRWQGVGFAKIDVNCGGLIRLDMPIGSVRRLAILTHPSLRRSNVGRRRYGGKSGNAAEIQLLRDVCC